MHEVYLKQICTFYFYCIMGSFAVGKSETLWEWHLIQVTHCIPCLELCLSVFQIDMLEKCFSTPVDHRFFLSWNVVPLICNRVIALKKRKKQHRVKRNIRLCGARCCKWTFIGADINLCFCRVLYIMKEHYDVLVLYCT